MKAPGILSHVHVREEFCVEERPGPAGIIIFGASGDLSNRKLIPSLYQLYQRDLMPEKFFILGSSRTKFSDQNFADMAVNSIKKAEPGADSNKIGEFAKLLSYVGGEVDDKALYQSIGKKLNELESKYGTGGNRIFYLAILPDIIYPVVDMLGAEGLTKEPDDHSSWARVIVEKPFGRDLESALDLDKKLKRILKEKQIYRIDHYLGKETVQNILLLRFGNAIFEPMWNQQYIDHVQITVTETLGVETRGNYYERAGLLRDMFENHMLQMLSLVAMEAPASFDADRVRDEKVKLLRSVRPFPLEELDRWIVRGQYDAGKIDGVDVPAYRNEKDVSPNSNIETYVAARFSIDNWRWQGVPFYLRAGKRLGKRLSEIAITFKRVPHSMFAPLRAEDLVRNELVLNVQPDEGLSLTIQAKHPGPKLCLSSLAMNFRYKDVFEKEPAEAYERLLLDAMLGDSTLFIRSDDMEIAWSLITPILKEWEREPRSQPYPYEAGGWGPVEADELLARDGRDWRKF